MEKKRKKRILFACAIAVPFLAIVISSFTSIITSVLALNIIANPDKDFSIV